MVFHSPKIITTNVQGSKIKAKSIEMAPVIGKVLVESTRGTSWVNGCWEKTKHVKNPWGWFCFRTSHPYHRRLLQLAGCFLVDMPLTKKTVLSSEISTQSQIFLDFCWIKTFTPKLITKPPPNASYYWFLHPLPHLHGSSLPTQKRKNIGWCSQTFKSSGLDHHQSGTTIQQKLPPSAGGEAEVHRHQPLFWSQFCSIWLVSLVVETILGISPSSCLYGAGYHWLISLAFPHSNISQ